MTLDDFPPLTSPSIEYDNTYFVFILGWSIISIRLMIQQTESSTCVSIFIHRCLVSNKEPRMGSFNHSWAALRSVHLALSTAQVFHSLSASLQFFIPFFSLSLSFFLWGDKDTNYTWSQSCVLVITKCQVIKSREASVSFSAGSPLPLCLSPFSWPNSSFTTYKSWLLYLFTLHHDSLSLSFISCLPQI